MMLQNEAVGTDTYRQPAIDGSAISSHENAALAPNPAKTHPILDDIEADKRIAIAYHVFKHGKSHGPQSDKPGGFCHDQANPFSDLMMISC